MNDEQYWEYSNNARKSIEYFNHWKYFNDFKKIKNGIPINIGHLANSIKNEYLSN
jgi:hypothetical protein